MNDAELEKLLNKIGHKIAEAAKERPEVPKDSLTTGQKVLGIAVSLLVVIGSLWAGLNYVVSSAINEALKAPSITLTSLSEQGVGLRRDVDRILTKQTFASSQKPSTPGEIKEVADIARRDKIAVDPASIQRVAEPLFINVDSAKWEATTSLVNLRSFVNSTLAEAKQHVVASIRAQLGRTDFPARKTGEWLDFFGAQFKLDGKPGETGTLLDAPNHALNPITYLIVRDSIVEYGGGEVTLINVFFDNCTFVISDNPRGRLLAEAILDPSPFTSFKSD